MGFILRHSLIRFVDQMEEDEEKRGGEADPMETYRKEQERRQ